MKKFAFAAMLISSNTLAIAGELNLTCTSPYNGIPDYRQMSVFLDKNKGYASIESRFKGANAGWNNPEVCELERYTANYRLKCGSGTIRINRFKQKEKTGRPSLLPEDASIRLVVKYPKKVKGIEYWCAIVPSIQDI